MATKGLMITDKNTESTGLVSAVDENNVLISWSDEREETLANEEFEALVDSDSYTLEEVLLEDVTTPAQQSIHTHSTADAGNEADGNPKTRLDWIKAVVGSLASASEESLEAMVFAAQQAQVGGAPEHATDGNLDGNRATIVAKPSGALGHGFVKTESAKVFGEMELSEEAQTKVATLFEVAVQSAVVEEVTKLQEKYDAAIDAGIAEIAETLEGKVESFMDATVNEWLEDNKVAIESTLRTELTMQFLGKLHTLFTESYIDVPEDKVDVLEAMVVENKTLEDKINKVTAEKIEQGKLIESLNKAIEVNKLSEGLTLPKKAQLAKLVETVEFTSVEDFAKKVGAIKESFLKDAKSESNILTETAPVVTEEKKTSSNPSIAAAAAKI